MNLECPQCHHLQSDEEAAFCEECGTPLEAHSVEVASLPGVNQPQKPVEKARSAEATIVEIPPTEPPAGFSSAPKGPLPSLAGLDYSTLIHTIQNRIGGISPSPSAPASFGPTPGGKALGGDPVSPEKECDDLSVKYCKELFFVSGKNAMVTIEIQPLTDVEFIDVWYSPRLSVAEKSPVYKIECDCVFRKGKKAKVVFSYTPDKELSGVVPFRFYFGCHCKESIRYYVMTASHLIFPETPTPQSIQFNADRASRIVWDGGAFSGSAEDKLKHLKESAELFYQMSLEETTWRPEYRERVYSCDQLTLMLGDFRIQLFGQKIIRLGRRLDCNDIIVADLMNGRSLGDHPNNNISRKHAQIHYCGDSVNLFDCNSSAGTFINDIRPTERGMVIPQEAVVAFGPIRWKMSMQRCEQRPDSLLCNNCLAHKIRSIVFLRMDNVPEAYLLVWQCCDLGKVRKELEGFQVLRREEGFLLRTPSGEVVSLVPGRSVLFGRGSRLEIKSYQQYGL